MTNRRKSREIEGQGNGKVRRFRRYSAYKDSGVEWLGEIPAAWDLRAVWTLFSLGRGRVISHEEIHENQGPYPVYSSQTENGGVMGNIATYDFDGDYLTWTTDGAKAGTVFVRSGKFNCTNVCGTLKARRSDQLDLRFVRDVLNVATTWFVRHDINPKLMNNVMARIRIQAPLRDEQRTIAAFLDRETARIDALAAKKERLIELLREKRASLITRAVNKGLDPSVPMKDSGVEWLGKIPAHWEVRRLKFLLAAPLKYGANEAAELDDPDLPRYVRITDIDENDGLREETFKSLPAEVATEYLLREGDLLFARSGATAGKSFLYRPSWGVCAYAGYLIRARLNTVRICPAFIRYFASSSNYWQWLSATYIQATIQNVSAERYASLMVPQPSLREQRSVAAFLDLETARIDALVAKVREAIDRLKELRIALISAAVTGKIDVRGEVA
ncbi:MAG: restriction endonuclease subunit S [Deltaproteobacteria bacterium]|nr:restriction endonuclease subunit S [Deltaproteobacteria bacterium]